MNNVSQHIKVFLSAVFFMVDVCAFGQTVIGTPGLMNIPTAEVREAGTFDGGASLMERELQPSSKNYNTGLYYVYFAPFSFVDVTFRETLLKCRKSATNAKVGFYQQDRSLSVRVNPLKEQEGQWWPSVLAGVNDFYSDHGGSYYAAVYMAMTKSLQLGGLGAISATAGYAHPIREGILYDGVFGGISISPACVRELRLMGEYDTRGVNVGLGTQLFRHLNLTCFTREFKGISATASYQYTIRY